MKKCFLFCILIAQVAFAFDNLELGTPAKADAIIDREGYALGYSAQHKQPLWVTYKLTRAEVKAKRVSRKGKDFTSDPALTVAAAQLSDYRRSGYDRGHMAPAADMGFSEKTMRESFYLSNICPQEKDFNSGIWADLEQKMRYWATVEGEIYIVTGPIFSKTEMKTIGRNRVTVPVAFYKAVLDVSGTPKAIAFLLPHQDSDKDLKTFVITIDELEERTGLDFFQALPDNIEDSIESTLSSDEWKWGNNKKKKKQKGGRK